MMTTPTLSMLAPASVHVVSARLLVFTLAGSYVTMTLSSTTRVYSA